MKEMIKAKIKLLQGSKMPFKAHKDDAAFDCFANCKDDIVIPTFAVSKVPLGFCLELPKDTFAEIRPRSGLSLSGVDAKLGTIDKGYTGEVSVIIFNSMPEPFRIKNGDKICQMMIHHLPNVAFDIVDELDETERGENGFGSTGK